MNPVIAKFISTLLASRTQAHIFHWQAVGEDSGAKHLALGAYYEDIVGLVDDLVESYQGRFGIITGFDGPSTFREDNDPLKYFKALNQYVEMIRTKLPQDSYIQNQVDEIVSLIQTTLYKLEYLH
jgi:DNA-binding ferritin-like protein